MPKHPGRSFVERPDPEVRASAGRIVDILQQLVLARPAMILPLEEIVMGILANHRVVVATKKMWERDDDLRSRGRTPLPPMPLSELPAMLALLESTAPAAATTRRSTKLVEKAARP